MLYWYDPMVPTQKFDKPGKSPFMDMQLVAKYADEAPAAPAASPPPPPRRPTTRPDRRAPPRRGEDAGRADAHRDEVAARAPRLLDAEGTLGVGDREDLHGIALRHGPTVSQDGRERLPGSAGAPEEDTWLSGRTA